MTASVPELEKRTSSAAGTIFEMRSATFNSRSVDNANTPPTRMAFARGLIHLGMRVAENCGTVAHPVVDVHVVVEVRNACAGAALT